MIRIFSNIYNWDFFVKTSYGFYPLTIFAKCYIIDIWQDPKYISTVKDVIMVKVGKSVLVWALASFTTVAYLEHSRKLFCESKLVTIIVKLYCIADARLGSKYASDHKKLKVSHYSVGNQHILLKAINEFEQQGIVGSPWIYTCWYWPCLLLLFSNMAWWGVRPCDSIYLSVYLI